MTRKNRIKIIKEIEKIRKSKVIAYFIGDRPNLPPAAIADDAVRVIYNHLEKMGKTKKMTAAAPRVYLTNFQKRSAKPPDNFTIFPSLEFALRVCEGRQTKSDR